MRRFEFVERTTDELSAARPGLDEFLENPAMSGTATEEEIEFLKQLRVQGQATDGPLLLPGVTESEGWAAFRDLVRSGVTRRRGGRRTGGRRTGGQAADKSGGQKEPDKAADKGTGQKQRTGGRAPRWRSPSPSHGEGRQEVSQTNLPRRISHAVAVPHRRSGYFRFG